MRNMLRTTLLLGCSALIALPAFAETTISFRYNDPDPEVIEAAIEAFEAANPDIEIELERISWGDSRTQFLREAAVGTGPDVVHIAFVWPLEMGSAGALLPLNDLIEKNGAGAGFDDFIATDLARDADGKIFGLPWTADTFSLVYMPSVLEEAGVEVPKTWDDLQAASRMVAEKTGKVGFGFPAGGSATNTVWFLVNYRLWSNGLALVEEDGNGGFRVGVDAPTLANSFKFFADFMGDGGNPDSNIALGGLADIGSLAPMVEGDQAFAILPPNVTKALIAAYQEKSGTTDVPYASVGIPTGSVGGISHMGGRMLGINANTDHPEESYKFMQFLISNEFFSDYLTAQFPASKSALAALEYPAGLEGYGMQLPNARTWGAYANGKTPIGTMWSETGREFGAILVGDKTPEEAAQSLIDTINEMLGS
uniref:ABC transporter substrate-binding protein n=1 Tax=Pararhizobium sp. IMCC3301 TaxID=3067904 RepID=UPI0027422BEB|nr:extracellular solute-binding protein [Pararhizobium sp. IMCC3301]